MPDTKPDLYFNEKDGLRGACRLQESKDHEIDDWEGRKLAAAYIFHFTQYTPRMIKDELAAHYYPVRLF